MDDFSDDGFDDLNVNVLEELESNAIQSTQTQLQPGTTQLQFNYEEFEDDDLDDTVITDDAHGNSVLLSDKPAAPSNTSRIAPQQPLQSKSWGPIPVPASHFRPQAGNQVGRPPAQIPLAARSSQYGARQSQAVPYSQMRPPTTSRATPLNPPRWQAAQASQQPEAGNAEGAALQARIEELELKLQTKDGEIDIVRRNLDKHRQDHDREVQSLKKQTAEQLARSERVAEAAKVAQQTATTELEFTRRDLREEVDRAKRREKDGGTPKKSNTARVWGVADGFEDIEMATAVSPSKGSRNRNVGAVASMLPDPAARLMRTPTKGKRKRPTIESPIMALETDEDVSMFNNEDQVAGSKELNAVLIAGPRPQRNTLGVDFLRVILNHSSGFGRPSSFDYLAGFSLPSKPMESLAAILFRKLAILGDSEDPMRLPIEFCDNVIELWLQCRKEGCLAPIGELVSMVMFTLQLNTIEIAPLIAEALVSAALDSWYEVGIPRLRNQSSAGDPIDATFANLKEHIPTGSILSVMYLTALGCATSNPAESSLSRPIVDFWNCVHPDFVLMMIKSHKQPVDDFIMTLKLLCTSALDDSIGPISTALNRTLDLVAPLIIERLSWHLVEVQQWHVEQEKQRLICFSLLQTLAAFARSSFGIRQLAANESAIPRLVIFLSRTIDELYDGSSYSRLHLIPELESSSPPTDGVEASGALDVVQDEPDEVQTLISHTMLLLHTVITHKNSGDSLNLPNKLAKFTGTQQKYLLSLGRLNFAEEGVSEDTAELAHELLELAVTEEDGAELGEFFGG